MTKIKRVSAARREIIHAYETIIQHPGKGTIVRQVAELLGRPLDKNGGHSHIRRVIKEYEDDKKAVQNV